MALKDFINMNNDESITHSNSNNSERQKIRDDIAQQTADYLFSGGTIVFTRPLSSVNELNLDQALRVNKRKDMQFTPSKRCRKPAPKVIEPPRQEKSAGFDEEQLLGETVIDDEFYSKYGR